jgi:hypothetical protein
MLFCWLFMCAVYIPDPGVRHVALAGARWLTLFSCWRQCTEEQHQVFMQADTGCLAAVLGLIGVSFTLAERGLLGFFSCRMASCAAQLAKLAPWHGGRRGVSACRSRHCRG